MEDLTSWVSGEAQNMGVDFSYLSSQTRNNIISILMSGLYIGSTGCTNWNFGLNKYK